MIAHSDATFSDDIAATFFWILYVQQPITSATFPPTDVPSKGKTYGCLTQVFIWQPLHEYVDILDALNHRHAIGLSATRHVATIGSTDNRHS